MPELETFQAQRPRLFSIAYRMLGSASEAEDVLQDAWVRLNNAGTTDVRSPQAFAATIVTRLCLDRLKSARVRREEYVGPWLPEPVLTAGGEGPDVLAERSESVTLAFLLLLETLSAEERAVFLLKEVFDYEHAEIAQMLGTTAANSRQLFHRARTKVRMTADGDVGALNRNRTARPARVIKDGPEARDARRSIAARFARAFQSSDASELAELLAADVRFVADGGGKAAAARRPFAGREDVVSLLVGFVRSARASGLASRATMELREVNSEAAVVLRVDGQLESVFVLGIDGGAITDIRVVRNPDKLAYLGRQLAVPDFRS